MSQPERQVIGSVEYPTADKAYFDKRGLKRHAGLCFSIAEMSTALPHAGGAYSFGRTPMGPRGGYITGLAENMEYVITTAAVCYFTGGYLHSIFSTPDAWQPAWWLGLYLVFAAVVLVMLFDNPDFRPDIIGVAIWFLCGLLYFALHGRKTLVYSPEEEFAIQQSQHSETTQ
jgi:L-asparagine transporter-like permease